MNRTRAGRNTAGPPGALADVALRLTAPLRTVTEWLGEPWAAVAETHSAVVFFAGDRAWKLKKPVDLGFLDFGMPEARAVACERETELNRGFTSGGYLGVASRDCNTEDRTAMELRR